MFRFGIIRGYVGSMKVAIVAYGHADNVVCLAKALSRYLDVTIFFVVSGNRFVASIFDWDISKLPIGLITDSSIIDRLIGNRIREYIGSAVKIFIVHTPNRSIARDFNRANLKCVREVSKYIIQQRYEIVHFNGSSGFQFYFHHFLKGKPKVYTIHDYLPHSGESTVFWRFANTAFNRLHVRMDYEFIQHYRFLAREFSEFYRVRPDRVHTVYCGPLQVYNVFADGKVPEEPHTMLFFGRISRYKGIEYLVRAVSIVRRTIPDVKMIIAGRGNIRFDCRNDGCYEIHNYHIPNEKLVKLINRASFVVAPYTDATHSAVIMTAFAFNKPVVASAVGGFAEVIQNNVTGRLVPPRDPHALATSLIDLLSKRGKRNSMKNKIKRVCNSGKFSWHKIAARTIQVYKAACCSP